MADESLRDFLDRREREILNRLIAARSVVSDLEGEYAEIRTAKSALNTAISPERTGNALAASLPYSVRIPGTLGIGEASLPQSGLGSLSSGFGLRPNPLMPEFSIRDLILSSLRSNDEFRRYGATNAELRQFIKDTTGRHIERTSLSTTLSRLRDDGVLVAWADGKWKLVIDA